MAGGAARRFDGRPKGLETVDGRRIIDRVVAALERVTGSPPLLVANAPEAATWRPDLRVVPDVQIGAGTLGGILTAVRDAPAPVLVVAWDMPFVPSELLQALADGLDTADACLPASGGRRGVEPLCAAYGPACAGPIERAIQRGDLRAIAFHGEVRVGIVPLEAVRRFGEPERLFFNVNTAADLRHANGLA
jgi:molybdopterin-guanine dinucleotide biosynthesis protein A